MKFKNSYFCWYVFLSSFSYAAPEFKNLVLVINCYTKQATHKLLLDYLQTDESYPECHVICITDTEFYNEQDLVYKDILSHTKKNITVMFSETSSLLQRHFNIFERYSSNDIIIPLNEANNFPDTATLFKLLEMYHVSDTQMTLTPADFTFQNTLVSIKPLPVRSICADLLVSNTSDIAKDIFTKKALLAQTKCD